MNRRSRQRGAALLALLLVLSLGGAWYLYSRLNAASANRTIEIRNQNAAVLARAKQALMGYVAQQAAITNEDNPGAFLCPETPSGMTSTTGTDGRTQTPSCTLPAVGRFPWRTIGSEMFVDASGEPLWYVVASGWSKPGPLTTNTTLINSNCTSDATMLCNTGMLTVDGVKDTVALIIAPGPAFNVPAAAGCATWNQVRTIAAGPDFRNYLECENATSPADATFVTTGPSGSFNDQVVKITAAEILPLVEGAVADRFTREIAPQLRSVYSGGAWPTAAGGVLPFAATFGNPSTSDFKGAAARYQGLLPLNYSETSPASGTPCTPGAGAPRCDPMFVAWTGTPTLTYTGGAVMVPNPMNCNVTTVTVSASPLTQTTRVDCTVFAWWLFNIFTGINFSLQANATNVGMALRQLNTAVTMTGVNAGGRNASAVLNNDGSATVTLTGSTSAGSLTSLADCGLGAIWTGILSCFQYTISVPIGLLADHVVLDATTASSTGWFVRNRWHEVLYYAMAPNIAPSGTRSCTTSTTCLQVTYLPSTGRQRGLVVFAGPRLLAQTRPAAVVSDLMEGSNATADVASPLTLPFALRSPTLVTNRSFNDHFAVIDSN